MSLPNHNMPKDDLEKIIERLAGDLARIRAGRASIGLVEDIEVDAYNSKMPLNQLATLSNPEPRLILVTPWDKSIIKDIENAIRSNMSDVNPVVESDVIRIPFPAPTEEKRKELVKEVGKIMEETKVKIRRVREDTLRELKEKEDKSEISEDELHRDKEETQKLISEYNTKVDEMGKRKEEEITAI